MRQEHEMERSIAQIGQLNTQTSYATPKSDPVAPALEAFRLSQSTGPSGPSGAGGSSSGPMPRELPAPIIRKGGVPGTPDSIRGRRSGGGGSPAAGLVLHTGRTMTKTGNDGHAEPDPDAIDAPNVPDGYPGDALDDALDSINTMEVLGVGDDEPDEFFDEEGWYVPDEEERQMLDTLLTVYTVEKRGRIPVKGKGMMKTYFIDVPPALAEGPMEDEDEEDDN